MTKFKSKKLLGLGLALAVSTILLTACTDQTTTTDMEADSQPTAKQAEEQTEETTAVPTMAKMKGYTSYENSAENLMMQYPQNWEMQENFMGSLVFFKSPQADSGDKFQENVNVVVQDLSGEKMDLEKFTRISIEQIESLITDAKVISPATDFTLNGMDAKKITYTGRQGDFKLKWYQVYFIENDKAYVLTYTAEIDQFDSYIIEAENIFKSLQIE